MDKGGRGKRKKQEIVEAVTEARDDSNSDQGVVVELVRCSIFVYPISKCYFLNRVPFYNHFIEW